MIPLERTLAKALTEVVIRLDLSDDDAITPAARCRCSSGPESPEPERERARRHRATVAPSWCGISCATRIR